MKHHAQLRRESVVALALLNVDDYGRGMVERQLNLTLRDFARWAVLFLREGSSLTGVHGLPNAWIESTLESSPHRSASFERSQEAGMLPLPDMQYHNQAWVLDPGEGVMAMLGIHGQFCYLDLSRDLMIVGYGSFPDQVHPVRVASLYEAWAGIAHVALD